jgi:biotin carboxylase
MEHAKRSGHTVTFLWSPLYEFTAPAATRDYARRLADHCVQVDNIHDPAATLGALRATGAAPALADAVFSTLSFCTPVAATVAEMVGARGTPATAVAAAGDKGRCREVLRANGIPSLGFQVVATAADALHAAEAIGYPVIIKPTLGIGKSVTSIARSADDVRTHFGQAQTMLNALEEGITVALDDRFIIEELAEGSLYSVEVAANQRRYVPLVAVRRKTGLENPVLELGCTVPSGLSALDEAELGRYAVDVCRALGLDLGIFHVEVMHTRAGFRLIEVNPRITGGSLPDTINTVADADIFAILVDLFAGVPVPLRPLRLTGAASHSFLAAARPARLPDDLSPDWFDEFRSAVHSGWVHVGPGDAVKEMKGNFDSFGMIRAVAAEPVAAEAACARVKEAIERGLGFPLLADQTQSSLPVPSTSAR